MCPPYKYIVWHSLHVIDRDNIKLLADAECRDKWISHVQYKHTFIDLDPNWLSISYRNRNLFVTKMRDVRVHNYPGYFVEISLYTSETIIIESARIFNFNTFFHANAAV